MRTLPLLLPAVFALVGIAGFGTLAAQEPEPERSTAPRVSRTNSGITIIRGSTSRSAGRAETVEATGEKKSEGSQPTALETTAPETKARRRESRQTTRFRYNTSGRRVEEQATSASSRDGAAGGSVETLANINGRRVPYIRETEKVVSKGPGTTVTEKRTQRYDVAGRPTRQDLVRVEERRERDGTVVTTSTVYRENLNGRMEVVERETTRTKETGSTTATTTTTEQVSVNGGFRAMRRVESVERKQGENRSTLETTRSVGDGSGRLQVASREETALSKAGNVATTETKVFSKNEMTGRMRQTERTVGRLVEQADGSSTEKIETYGFATQGGGTNVNASRMTLQEVVERRTTVKANGETMERTSVRSRDVANPSQLAAARVSQKVTRPTGDGETVRTEIYERGVNGRMRASGVTVEQVKK